LLALIQHTTKWIFNDEANVLAANLLNNGKEHEQIKQII
jgi:hypothetical protein